MKYRTPLSVLAACLLLVLAGAACDSDKKSTSDDGEQAAPATSEKADKGADEQQEERARSADAGNADAQGQPSATSGSGTVAEKPPLEIADLLTPKDAEEIANGGTFKAEHLVGEPPSPDYNARHLRPEQGNDYGVGLQVWSFQKVESAEKRFQDLKSQYLAVKEAPEAAEGLAGEAFLSQRSGIKNLVFHIDTPPRIIAVSCSTKLCQSQTDLMELAEKVAERVQDSGE